MGMRRSGTRRSVAVLALAAGLAVTGVAAGMVAGAGTPGDGIARPADVHPGAGLLSAEAAGLPPVSLPAAAGLIVSLTAAGLLQVRYRYREEYETFDLFEAILTPVMLALPGPSVVAVVAAAKAASQAGLRVAPVKAAFNVAQWVCATGVASLAFAALRADGSTSPANLPPLLAAMAVVPLVNFAALAVVRRIAYRAPLREVLSSTAPTFLPGLVNGAVSLCAGALFAAAFAWAPAASGLMLVPLALLQLAGKAHANLLVDRARLLGMQRATHALAVPVDPRAAVGVFLEEVRRCFNAPAAEAILVDKGGRSVHRSDGSGQARVDWQPAERDTLAARLARVPRPTRLHAQDGDPLARALRAAGRQACLVAPLRASGQVGGALCVYDRDGFEGFEDGELAVLDALAGELGSALARGELLAQLTYQATHDALTGVANRVAFIDRARLALARSERTGESVAVLFLDIDRFKFVNDSFGHDAGDRLLKDLAGRLEGVVRPGDTLARFGGDEFTLLCEGLTAESDAMGIADRVNEVLAKPFQLDEGEVFVTCSIGVAVASGGHHRPEDLVTNADAAMYRAKAAGGDRREAFDLAVRKHAKRRLDLQNALYHALERGEFRVLYQPAVSLRTGEVVGVEALVRWLHPERGLIAPGEFIGLAEETGLIVPLGVQVLRDACRTAARWQSSGPLTRSQVAAGAATWPPSKSRPPRVSVNLSARQFSHPGLVKVVSDILNANGTDPASICFEITESVLMEDVETTTAALHGLKRLGVQLTIDDFGTGYSSLSYLKRFPVDELKVDRSFVDGLGTDPEDSAIVAAVVKLAHALDLEVVAEGVETAEQSRHLRDLGCDTAQGYFYGRPVPAHELEARWWPR
jgi:diguanylate cyclase (GGDEF)-like protein